MHRSKQHLYSITSSARLIRQLDRSPGYQNSGQFFHRRLM
jgi:hypothetical protein